MSSPFEDRIPKAVQRPCTGLRMDLKRCLLDSDCCKYRKLTPLQCIKEKDIPENCEKLRQAFFICKRSILDMRTRFRGLSGY